MTEINHVAVQDVHLALREIFQHATICSGVVKIKDVTEQWRAGLERTLRVRCSKHRHCGFCKTWEIPWVVR